MSQRTTGLRAALSSAAVYQAPQDLPGGRRFQRRLVDEYVRPAPGTRLLDIGCGTGAILEHVPAGVAYHGFDLSERAHPQKLPESRATGNAEVTRCHLR